MGCKIVLYFRRQNIKKYSWNTWNLGPPDKDIIHRKIFQKFLKTGWKFTHAGYFECWLRILCGKNTRHTWASRCPEKSFTFRKIREILLGMSCKLAVSCCRESWMNFTKITMKSPGTGHLDGDIIHLNSLQIFLKMS